MKRELAKLVGSALLALTAIAVWAQVSHALDLLWWIRD
jgi:hypothetical protein